MMHTDTPIKRLVFCFDGTWNRLDAPCPTNVVLTAESTLPLSLDGTAQLIYYDEGVGTGALEYLRGGVFGAGLVKNLADAYRHLIFNYTPGDEIYVLGFSRGAYTARSFVGLLRNCGIVARSDAAMVGKAVKLYESRASEDAPDAEAINVFRSKFSPAICVNAGEDEWRCRNVPGYSAGSSPLLRIAYLGVWDTVGALGIPSRYRISNLMNRRHRFHDAELTSMVRSARHAVAIDETRVDFAPTLWAGFDQLNNAAGADPDAEDAPYQQKWFPGTHGSVGGGGDFRGLSDQALDWVWDGARLAGLELDTSSSSRIYGLRPDHAAPVDNVDRSILNQFGRAKAKAMDMLWKRADRKNGPTTLRDVSVSARRRWHVAAASLPEQAKYNPATLSAVKGALDADVGQSAPSPVPEPGTFDVVVVMPGDSLRRIARDRLGAVALADEIFRMNLDKLEHPDRIYSGMSLRIPPHKSV